MIYGAPFNRGVQVNRLLRRARPGLVRGRSEAVAPVRLSSDRRRRSGTGTAGGPGAPGPNGTARMARGNRIWARPVASPNFSTAAILDTVRVTFSVLNGSTSSPAFITAPPTDDIQALPRFVVEPSSGSPGDIVSIEASAPTFVPGSLSSHDGFSIVAQFAFTTLTAGRRWFVGLTELSGGAMFGEPSSSTGLLGVGQDSGDTSPQFMHSADFPASGTTKFSTALPSVVENRIYEARLYWGPGMPSAQLSFESFANGVSTGIAAYDTGSSTRVPTHARRWIMYLSNGSSGINRFALLGFFAEFHPGTAI